MTLYSFLERFSRWNAAAPPGFCSFSRGSSGEVVESFILVSDCSASMSRVEDRLSSSNLYSFLVYISVLSLISWFKLTMLRRITSDSRSAPSGFIPEVAPAYFVGLPPASPGGYLAAPWPTELERRACY